MNQKKQPVQMPEKPKKTVHKNFKVDEATSERIARGCKAFKEPCKESDFFRYAVDRLLESLKICAVLAILGLSACGSNDRPRPLNVLIISDSIGQGYAPYLKRMMSDDKSAVVQTPLANIRSSENGVKILDQSLNWGPKWDVITFNVGLHDIRLGVSVDEYKKNLRNIAKRIRKTGAVPVFFTTTHSPREETDRAEFNEAAREVMSELKIGVYDLGKFSESQIEMHINPINVHWTKEGSKRLAGFVRDAIVFESVLGRIRRHF